MDKEDRIQTALQEWASSCAASPELRMALKAKVKPRRRTWAVALTGAGATAAVVGLILAMPSIALANTLKQIETAIKQVKTMRVETFVHHEGKSERKATELYYKDGMWRSEIFIGTALAESVIIRDGKTYIYKPYIRQATFESRAEGWWHEGEMSALDFALEETNWGSVGLEREIEKRSHAPIDGKKVFELFIKREDDDTGYRCSILVDQKTNLPIKSVVSHTGLMARASKQTQVYSFDDPIPDRKFAIDFEAGVRPLDLMAAQKKLVRQWSKPLAEFKSGTKTAHLRDLQVNEAGEVFLVYSTTAPKSEREQFDQIAYLRPYTVRDGEGTVYLRVNDYRPGGTQGDTHSRENTMFGDEMMRIAVWVPLTKPRSLPKSLDFGFVMSDNPDVSRVPPLEPTTVANTVRANVQTFMGDFPDYSLALVLDRFHPQVAVQKANARASYFEKDLKQYEAAVPWYKVAYDREKLWLRSVAHRNLDGAIRCLQALGRAAEAEELIQLKAEEKAADPNERYQGPIRP